MNIAMFTNTYLPHVGGVARSVSSFVEGYRKRGHGALVVAPVFPETPEDEEDVLRVPAITDFNDSGFSVRLAVPSETRKKLDAFAPDLIHAHHPFLLGDNGLREAWARDLPLVFTHHTLYEEYIGYLPVEGEFTRKAAIEIATGFANACSLVFAPSESVRDLIRERGVRSPVTVQPSGIDVDAFRSGDGDRFRQNHGIDQDRVVIGHVGRLAREKNLPFLVRGCARALERADAALLVLVGDGDAREEALEIARDAGVGDRLIDTGALEGDDLYDAYAAFDLFAFTSQSETQGLVVAEAMAGGAPVVALDGPGVSDVVEDGKNGRLLEGDAAPEDFAEAIADLVSDENLRASLREGAAATADAFSTSRAVESALENYERIIRDHTPRTDRTGFDQFDRAIAQFDAELKLLGVKASTLLAALGIEGS